MNAIFRGRRFVVVGRTGSGVWLESQTVGKPSERVHVSPADPDLILEPAEEDLDLAEAYERGEISAFEYVDGHTYPPGREIKTPQTK